MNEGGSAKIDTFLFRSKQGRRKGRKSANILGGLEKKRECREKSNIGKIPF